MIVRPGRTISRCSLLKAIDSVSRSAGREPISSNWLFLSQHIGICHALTLRKKNQDARNRQQRTLRSSTLNGAT